MIYKTLHGKTVWALPVMGGDPEPVLELGARVDEAQISPDGRWLAYVSEEASRGAPGSGPGAWDVYVAPRPLLLHSRM